MSRYRRTNTLLACLALGLSLTSISSSAENQTGTATETKVFELRTYTTYDGRLDALNARFADHSIELLKKHGAEVVGFWTPLATDEAENTLVYLVAFPSRKARDDIWHAVFSDPAWPKIKADSEKDGKVVQNVDSLLLTPTEYSPLQ